MKTIEMKRTLSILCLLSFSLFMNGQQATGYTKTRNYTAERTYMDASSQTGSGGARIVSDIVYTDCFGRKEQEIQVGGSPGGNADLVLSYTYNMMGQVEKEYLPYAKTGNNGAFDKFSPERWSVYGTGEQAYAYNLTQYEDSPLMRVSRKMGPGKAWHTSDKSVRVTYGMNSTNEVRCYKVSSSGSLIASGFYGAGKLEVIVETDEDGHRSCNCSEFFKFFHDLLLSDVSDKTFNTCQCNHRRTCQMCSGLNALTSFEITVAGRYRILSGRNLIIIHSQASRTSRLTNSKTGILQNLIQSFFAYLGINHPRARH